MGSFRAFGPPGNADLPIGMVAGIGFDVHYALNLERRAAGRRRVFRTLYLKVAGWNILRASVCAKMRELVHARAQTAVCRLSAWLRTIWLARRNAGEGLETVWATFQGLLPYSLGLTLAA